MGDLTTTPPTSINPYETLNLEKTATADQIKTAYRKAALKHHPDKAPSDSKSTAHTKFQEIALAYAILSSPQRKKRYDTTGRTEDSLNLSDDDFNWTDFFRAQYADTITSASLERFASEYKNSEEEEGDVLVAYTKYEGNMDAIYEDVMLSHPLEDEERFRRIIDEGIRNGVVDAYETYTKESKAKKKRRMGNAKREAEEAQELAEELGVADKLFPKTIGNGEEGKRGKKKGAKISKAENTEDALAALIQQRQKGRNESFLDNLEAKYGGGAVNGRKKKRDGEIDDDEPSEEAFQKAASQLKGGKKDAKDQDSVTGEANGSRKSKRAKK